MFDDETGWVPILLGTADAPEWFICIATQAPCLWSLSVRVYKLGINLSSFNLIWVVPLDPYGKSTQTFSTIISPVPPFPLCS